MTYTIYRAADSTDDYLNTMGRVPMMTSDEQLILGRLVRRGQELRALERELTRSEVRELRRADKAKRRFIEANLRLVVQIAGKFKRHRVAQHLELTDLSQFGVFGLIRAVEKFDPTRGYKFSTYAYRWIQQSISRSINYYERLIHLPDKSAECARKLPHVQHKLAITLGRNPTQREIAEECGVSEEEVRLIMQRGCWAVSLDTPCAFDGCGSDSLVDLIPYPQSEERDDFVEHLDVYREQLNRSLDVLTSREHQLLVMHYGLNGGEAMSTTEIGRELKLNRETCRQTIHNAVRKLTAEFNPEGIGSRIAA